MLLVHFIVLAVLKKNYTKLCHCLPQDYMKTFSKINKLLGPSDDLLNPLTVLPTADLINEAIIGTIMVMSVRSDRDALQFCDILEKLVDTQSSLIHIRSVRNGK